MDGSSSLIRRHIQTAPRPNEESVHPPPRSRYAQSANDVFRDTAKPNSLREWFAYRAWLIAHRINAWRQARKRRRSNSGLPVDPAQKEKVAWWVAALASILWLSQISFSVYLIYLGVHIANHFSKEHSMRFEKTEFAKSQYLEHCNKPGLGPTYSSVFLNCTYLYGEKEINPFSFALESVVYHTIEHFSIFYWLGGCHDAQCTSLLYEFAKYVLTNPFKLILVGGCVFVLAAIVCVYAWWTFYYWHREKINREKFTAYEPIQAVQNEMRAVSTNPHAMEADFDRVVQKYIQTSQQTQGQEQRLLLTPTPYEQEEEPLPHQQQQLYQQYEQIRFPVITPEILAERGESKSGPL